MLQERRYQNVSAIEIQRYYRGHSSRQLKRKEEKLAREELRRKNRAAALIQARVRGAEGRRAAYFRELQVLQAKADAAAVKVQTVFRRKLAREFVAGRREFKRELLSRKQGVAVSKIRSVPDNPSFNVKASAAHTWAQGLCSLGGTKLTVARLPSATNGEELTVTKTPSALGRIRTAQRVRFPLAWRRTMPVVPVLQEKEETLFDRLGSLYKDFVQPVRARRQKIDQRPMTAPAESRRTLGATQELRAKQPTVGQNWDDQSIVARPTELALIRLQTRARPGMVPTKTAIGRDPFARVTPAGQLY